MTTASGIDSEREAAANVNAKCRVSRAILYESAQRIYVGNSKPS